MTAWWVSTTKVRKVRARSSERFRDLALGTAPTSACPTAEIDVMRASRPDCLCRMLRPGAGFSKAQLLRDERNCPPGVAAISTQPASSIVEPVPLLEVRSAIFLYEPRIRRPAGWSDGR